MTWTPPASLGTNPDDPVTSQLMNALADNPVALADGDSGAPRIVLKAIERIDAGTQIRSSVTTATGGRNFPIIQIGEVNIEIFPAAGTPTSTIARTRNGNTVVLSSTGGAHNVDVSVLPGDIIECTGAGGSTFTYRLRTNGSNWWPVQVDNFVVNNDV